MDVLKLELPYPPSINHYYLRTRNGVILGKKGRSYREEVTILCQHAKFMFPKECKLAVAIELFPPDKRRRDIDNTLKALLDSMQHANIYADDNQIDYLSIVRCEPVPKGKVLLVVTKMEHHH